MLKGKAFHGFPVWQRLAIKTGLINVAYERIFTSVYLAVPVFQPGSAANHCR
jgi:hypothetical protein